MPTTLGSWRTLSIKALVASLVAMPFFGRATRAESSDEEIIRELNAGYVRAFLTSDADWYDRHLTTDFRCILTSGAIVERVDFLANARKPHTVVSYDLSEVSIRVHGDAALVSALGAWKRSDGTSGRTRYVDVWIRRDGSWKAASAQLTSVATP